MRASFSLAGKVAIVTGAAGLLGRRHCQALAAAGAQVIAVDVRGEECGTLAREIASAHGTPTHSLACDVSDPGSVERLVEDALRWGGGVDVLVNNAAVDDKVEAPRPEGPLGFEDYPFQAWELSVRVNLTGTFLCCQKIGREMARRGSGSIVNIGSTYALVAPDPSLYRGAEGRPAFHKSAAYPATKAAVLGLTRYLGAYWGRSGVRVNALSPGGVENGQDETFVQRYSERTPLGRMAQADEYGGALVFLASDASRYMTGANLVVDGGFTTW
jgi:NAD(P)-dependent dehydrogenase (short-subunit alcohol dehydrogenase family)